MTSHYIDPDIKRASDELRLRALRWMYVSKANRQQAAKRFKMGTCLLDKWLAYGVLPLERHRHVKEVIQWDGLSRALTDAPAYQAAQPVEQARVRSALVFGVRRSWETCP